MEHVSSVRDVLEGVIEVGAQGTIRLRRELLLELVDVPCSHVAGAVNMRIVSHTGFQRDSIKAFTGNLGVFVWGNVQIHDFAFDDPRLPSKADADFSLRLGTCPLR